MTDVLPSRCSWPEAPALLCRPVQGADERAAHHRIRREVFVAEQGLFAGSDRDARDDDPATMHVLGWVDGEPAGTVRLYPLDDALDEPGLWKGDRLAVRSGARSAGLGAPLVRFAVETAGACGGTRMVAQVQAPHVGFFRGLGWTPVGAVHDLLGVPHRTMTIPLAGR